MEHLAESYHNVTNVTSNPLDSFDSSLVFPWIFKRFRGLLYLSNPAEESFEFPHQVPDYHTEVSSQ